MSRKIRVVEKKLGREGALGEAISSDREIHIDPRQSPKEYAATALHEMLHVACPDLSEREVVRIERVIAPALWSMGYRKCSL